MNTPQFNALQVLRLTPATRAFLKANDPQALKQADAAAAQALGEAAAEQAQRAEESPEYRAAKEAQQRTERRAAFVADAIIRLPIIIGGLEGFQKVTRKEAVRWLRTMEAVAGGLA